MNILKILFILLCFIQCSNKDEIDTIVFKYLEWEIYTFIRVDCDKIETYSEQVFQFELTNPDTIKSILGFIDELSHIEEMAEPDVRIKLEIMSKNNILKKLCIGNNGITILNSNKVSHSEELVSYLRRIIESKYSKIQP